MTAIPAGWISRNILDAIHQGGGDGWAFLLVEEKFVRLNWIADAYRKDFPDLSNNQKIEALPLLSYRNCLF
jgi:hypothetical protein